MWYVIQTITGKEEELMLFMRTILCRELCDICRMDEKAGRRVADSGEALVPRLCFYRNKRAGQALYGTESRSEIFETSGNWKG